MGNFYMEATQINYRRDDKPKTVDQKLQELSETSAIDTDIAPVFKSTNTYQPGDMVYYRNKLYVFNVEHTGTWAAADVTATDVTTELSSLKSGLMNLNGYIKTYNSANSSYKKLRITTQYGKQPVIIALVNNGVNSQMCFGMLTSNYGFIGVGTPIVTCDEVNFTIDISLEKYSGDVLLISSRDFTFAEIDPS